MTNLSDTARSLPDGAVLLSSAPLSGDRLPPWTTAWVRTDG
ncbi:hypothetical protein [Streptomyces platensis]